MFHAIQDNNFDVIETTNCQHHYDGYESYNA